MWGLRKGTRWLIRSGDPGERGENLYFQPTTPFCTTHYTAKELTAFMGNGNKITSKSQDAHRVQRERDMGLAAGSVTSVLEGALRLYLSS